MTTLNNSKNIDTSVAKEESTASQYVGRIVGVGSALLSTGLDISNNGVTISNVAGAVVGATCGYLMGDLADAATKITGSVSVPLIALSGATGFTAALGTTINSRILDKQKEEDLSDELAIF